MSSEIAKTKSVSKMKTGISGFDQITMGGLPTQRTTLVAGTAGASKTVFAVQFLAEGIIQYGDKGVFITFEESPEDIRRNMASLGWDIATWEKEGKWSFVDAAPRAGEGMVFTGNYDLGALMARIEAAVKKVGASRLALDSLGAIFTQFTEQALVRGELFTIASGLRQLGVTSLMTAERTQEYGEIARFGVEEFVADNVIILRNVLENEKRRRTVEVLKLRGTEHQKGEYPFTVLSGDGMIVIPLSAIKLKQRSSNVRVSSGCKDLDEMCGGGLFRDSIVLVSGATGCGKTLITTEFMNGAQKGERCLLFAYEESRDQLFRNAAGWGMDYEQMERDGLLKVVAAYPETMSLEDHLIVIKKEISAFKPSRVAIDSLSALERVSTVKGFREFTIAVTSYIKHEEIVGLFTATTSTLLGGESVTDAHISTITDSIILLRYVEMFGEMRRGITVLKMRGSMHEKNIREYSIDAQGLHIGKAFSNVTGILSGNPQHVPSSEVSRLTKMFEE